MNLTLKGIPTDLHRALRARAKAKGRSLNREIIATLQTIALARPENIDEHLDRARRLRGRIAEPVSTAELLEMIDAGR